MNSGNGESRVSGGLHPLKHEQRCPVRAVDLVRANRTERWIALLEM